MNCGSNADWNKCEIVFMVDEYGDIYYMNETQKVESSLLAYIIL